MSMELRTWYQAISTVENKSRTVLWVHVLFFHVFDHKSMKTEGKKENMMCHIAKVHSE